MKNDPTGGAELTQCAIADVFLLKRSESTDGVTLMQAGSKGPTKAMWEETTGAAKLVQNKKRRTWHESGGSK